MSKDWKDKARKILKTYYLSFSGTQWHSFNTKTDSELLKVKICYAIFGPPTNADASTIEEAYSDKQKNSAQEIIRQILQVKRDGLSSEISIGFVFVVCHEDGKKNEFVQPVFSALAGTKPGSDKKKFVDMQGRIYDDWDDWKRNNCLPKVEIAYPANGYFTSENGTYVFDSERDPVIEFGKSPQCSAWSTTKTVGDIVTGVTSIGCAAIGIASLFTPLAPVVLTASAVAGGVSASYGAVRGVGALVDKGTHGQSLKDLESLTLWFSIAATPLHFASSAVTGVLARGAVQEGRIFSQGMRTFASVLLCTTFGLDTALISFSFANLVKKYQDNQLTTLDVVQFSMSAFFFTNTLIQPKTAHGVIKKAQTTHFDRISKSMTDKTVKETFDKFLKTNKVDGSIQDRSKIVRAVNRMKDPNKFFTKAAADPSVKSIEIGGRKGKTVLLGDSIGNRQRVSTIQYQSPVAQPSQAGRSNQLQKQVNKTVKKCFGKNPSDIELNGKKIFDNLDDLLKKDVSRKLGGTAKNDPVIVQTALTIAEKMKCTTVEEYLSMVEIIASEVKGKSPDARKIVLTNLKQDSALFIQTLQSDLVTAESIARRGDLTFKDPYKAVYHYRKHGEEFPRFISKYGNTVEVYLGPVKNHVIKPSNLCERMELPDGSLKYTYITTNDELGVVISKPGKGKTISTIFKDPGRSKLYYTIANDTVPEVAKLVATNLGLPAYHVVVTVNGEKKPIEECDSLSEVDHEIIANLLMSFNDTL